MTPAEQAGPPVITLETGETRSPTSSNRVFFVSVTPTGAELALSRCAFLRKEWGQSTTTTSLSGDRLTVAKYVVSGQCTLKMVVLQSRLGHARHTVNLYLQIDPEAPVITLSGVDNFGRFTGRARVVTELSRVSRNRQDVPVTKELLRQLFDFKIIKPSKNRKAGRSLIF